MLEYWCIDDDTPNATSQVALLNRSSKDLHITLKEPKPIKDLIEDISKAKPDGLLLDLRLDILPSETNFLAGYRAGALAQQAREMSVENLLAEIPIVLWSSEPNLQKSYNRDVLSHDLFDDVFIKNRIPDDAVRYASKLTSFADGYREISKTISDGNPLAKVLRAEGEAAEYIETIILSAISWDSLKVSVSALARWILQKLMRSPGPLIDELTLAARLGIDINASQGWIRLRDEVLATCKYQGPFKDVHQRWWALSAEEWWDKTISKSSLALLSADERVATIIEKLSIKDLSVIPKRANGDGNRYWYVCEMSQLALDPKDGLAMVDNGLESWNEPKYVSIEYALSDSKVSLQSMEKDRLKAIKAARSKSI